MKCVIKLRKAMILPVCWFVDISWTFHAKGFMRPFIVVLVDKMIESGLLLQDIHARRSCGLFFKCKVHTLMPAVLLRTSGCNALDTDPEPKPPDREFAQVK